MIDVKVKGKVVGKIYEEEDYKKLLDIYSDWKNINEKIKTIKDNGRSINLPEVVSEGLYSYYFEAIRTNVKSSTSADLVNSMGEEIQVKAATIENDLTSFGPNSKWDILIYMDFSILDQVSIYQIPSEKLYNKILNNDKQETFKMQQEQGRRPRLSIKKIIRENDIHPLMVRDLKI